MRKKLLFMEDLLQFFLTNNLTKFSSADSGYKLSVQIPAKFEVEDSVDEDHRGMMRLKFRIFHLDLNRNGSFVSEDAAKDAMPTIKDRPVMAYIHQLDNGEWDFETHNMTIKEDENGDEFVEYEERQVGSFSQEEPFFEYDKELDKTYVCAYAYISEQYTKACDIIRRKGGTKNSVELVIEELAFNAKEKYLDLKKFYVSASTLLGSYSDGTEVAEGMLGSRADIADFSMQNNSILSNDEFINSIADAVVQRLSDKAEFSAKNLEEGGESLNKFEELLNMYEKTVEDITFEYENLSDEELEEAFKNAFAVSESEDDSEGDAPSEDDETPKEPESEEAFADDDPVPGDDESDDESDDEPESEEHQSVSTLEDEESGTTKINNSIEYSVNIDGKIKQFSVSLGEKINAVSTLINDTYSESDNTWYYCDVYEEPRKYVVMHDFWFDRHFRQEYSVKKDVYSLKGDRIQVFTQYLTSDEISQLESMKSNYSAIESELNEYKSKELHTKRENILSSESYSVLKNDKDFKELIKNMDNYSVEDLSKEADLIFAKYMKSHNTFSAKKNPYGIVNMNADSTEKDEKLPYGGLFKDFKKK